MADWLETLESLVKDEWKEHGVALLLSRVPALMAGCGFSMEEILKGRKWRVFLETDPQVEGRFRVIQNEGHSIVWGVVPADAQVSEPYSRYFRTRTSAKPIRFAPAAWKAFTLPIPEDRRRWIVDEPSIGFADHPAENVPETGYEIERRFIVPEETGGDNEVFKAEVQASIASWASELQIEVSRFGLGRKRVPVSKAQRPATIIAEGGAETALDQLIGLLQPAERTRISLPLDVVERLRSIRLASEH
ncbi:hypothetical protein [Brevundimonas sp.]|uniref:hypothetical protein n=1 Tax=Brevundimonas sp. TaxID=1871086 RepID=UPI0037BFFF7C